MWRPLYSFFTRFLPENGWPITPLRDLRRSVLVFHTSVAMSSSEPARDKEGAVLGRSGRLLAVEVLLGSWSLITLLAPETLLSLRTVAEPTRALIPVFSSPPSRGVTKSNSTESSGLLSSGKVTCFLILGFSSVISGSSPASSGSRFSLLALFGGDLACGDDLVLETDCLLDLRLLTGDLLREELFLLRLLLLATDGALSLSVLSL
mmetsp:Transcript_19285/g.25411  ORF Transcript_19285/g.25411 Transcript_19285/m.25411 type:complete len:206 (-) Transcript_19285:1070-1687(-)